MTVAGQAIPCCITVFSIDKSGCMKKIPFVFRCFIVLTLISLFTVIKSNAQKNGILPFTGLRYFSEGVSAGDIKVNIDGAQLLSNRIPLNKEIEVRLIQPTGFTADNSKTVYAAAEIIVLSPRGEILSNEPNILAKKHPAGITGKEINNFNIRFSVDAGLMKNNFNGLVKIRLYDLKGKNQLRLEMPVTFARMGEKLQVSKSAKAIKCPDGVKGMINGLQAKKMLVNVDTSIKVAPSMAYTSMNISSIEGSSISGIFQGKENFWVYDSNLNEVKISDILLKQVKGAMENNTVDYTLKIPYRRKTDPSKIYTVRFRWESPDKSQVIDVVVTI
jgi:hypothetical protein